MIMKWIKCWSQGGSFMSRLIALTLTLALGTITQARVSAQEKPRIIVGPNILVSRDGDVAHCETMIAANPRNPKNLIGGSIVLSRPDGSSVDKPYVSADGGATWSDITLPEEMAAGSGDPQVGFGITGTAYFVGLSSAGMNFY